MKTSIRVVGFKDLFSDIGIAGQKLKEVVQDTIDDAGLRTQEFAIRGIQGGPATGRTYEKYTPRRTHQASAPGEFPMSDTGRLAASVAIEGLGTNVVSVGTNVRYGPMLEFGTSNMRPRPWLTPSAERATEGVTRDAKKRYIQKMGGK